MHPTRQKLLDTGLAIATEKGLRGLTVRELAAGGGGEPGSFVYPLRHREPFIDELVELWYAPLYDELKAVAAKGSYPSAIPMIGATMEALIGLGVGPRGVFKYPLSGGVGMGPPSPGFVVLAASMPGRGAAPPAPAMMARRPRSRALAAYSNRRSGVRWADTTRAS